MAERNSGGGFSIVFNALLVLFTVLGGVMLVSQRLTSERPIAPAGKPQESLGQQSFQARLWEDPFLAGPENKTNQTDFNDFLKHAQEESDSNELILLPVMISGGPYAEDRESRIRSRIAIVSGLGRRGYVPDDAEHIGETSLAWPKTEELKRWKAIPSASLELLSPDMSDCQGVVTVDRSSRLHIRYEWYRARVFQPGAGDAKKKVLVLWVDDDLFDDEPLLRLALFLKPLLPAIQRANLAAKMNAPGFVKLIGPRRSSTLRNMMYDGVPEYHRTPMAKTNPELWNQVTDTLRHVDLYSATVSAMDEVMVKNDSHTPRERVSQDLLANGFHSVNFLNANDAQLASEVYQELRLRRVDVNDVKNHIVLISEWDTFYGRTLALAYGATLSVQQGHSASRQEFLDGYRKETLRYPSNFHNYVYLRGLDGRTGEKTVEEKTTKGGRERARPSSLGDVLAWTPDANKAEGNGQFDYLSRTGEWLEELQTELRSTEKGEIKAVGILGSDVYDVLLILQALRHRFPGILFFTTDLDARYWHPNEREWTRNLIVASSYGLRLGPTVQREIPSFRDSSQTAMFAATLKALDDPALTYLTSVPPQRFEIGNRLAVNLSIHNAPIESKPPEKALLHPSPRDVDSGHHDHPWRAKGLLYALGMLLCVALIAGWYVLSPFRERNPHETGCYSKWLVYADADIGGVKGADGILLRIFASEDSLCLWFKKTLIREHPELFNDSAKLDHRLVALKSPATNELPKLRSKALLGLLNQLVHHGLIASEERAELKTALTATALIPAKAVNSAAPWNEPLKWWSEPDRLWQRRKIRMALDEFLKSLAPYKNSPTYDVPLHAREAAGHLSRLTWKMARIFCCTVILAALVGCFLGLDIWNDTFHRPHGEPFSLFSGVSAWPNVILRIFSFLLSLAFIDVLLVQLSSLFYELSRTYRMPTRGLIAKERPESVCASALWQKFQKTGHWGWRLIRSGLPAGLYLTFGILLIQLTSRPTVPLRGDALALWSGDFWRYAFVLAFLLLSFLTVDATLRCRRFINDLSAAPTDYPETTRDHFKSLRGDVDEEFLDEWIDTQLIADLTERVGRLLWFPGIIFLLMLLSLNRWTDDWHPGNGLLVIFVLNFCLAIASVVILQRTAIKAKEQAEESLLAKVKKAQRAASASVKENNVAQAEKLLEEIRNLRRGAFTGFWDNPVVGAILLPSGGTALVQILSALANR